MSSAFVESTILSTETCCSCGILFAIPEDFQRSVRKTQERFYCPNGHGQSYSKSEAQIVREELSREKENRMREQRRSEGLERELRSQKFKTMAERSAKVRLKRRIAAGVCPCCQRSFENLRRHMATKHPEVTKE